ncbi:MAG: hypothetical protein U5L11_03315 [Arhodomonas sp.]|nr:hypothetical protein [Arhodomonas sp.]
MVAGLVIYLLLSRCRREGLAGPAVDADRHDHRPVATGATHHRGAHPPGDRRPLGRVPGAAAVAGLEPSARHPHACSGDARFSLITSVLAGFGRAAAEVGAVLIVGGNISGYTRVMTTAIALETSKGELGLALALGIILIGLIVAVNAVAFAVGSLGRRYGS